MATIATQPQYPIPGQRCTMQLSDLIETTNYVAVYRVSAPVGSQVYEDIQKTKGQRGEPIYAGSTPVDWIFTPDIGGVYVFQVLESTIQDPATSRFDSDATGAPSPTITASGNVTVYIGERLSCELGAAPDTARLVVYVWNATVRATTLAEHDEETPVIELASSPAAERAANSASLLSTIATFDGETTTAILGSFSAQFDAAADAVNDHLGNGTVHNDPDGRVFSYGTSTSSSGADSGVRRLREILSQHSRTETYLDTDGVTTIDVHDAPDASADAFVSSGSSPKDWSSCWAALADLIVRLREHQTTSTPIHNSVDSWVAPTMEPLLTCHYQFMTELNADSPATPQGRNSGAAHLEQFAGFEK